MWKGPEAPAGSASSPATGRPKRRRYMRSQRQSPYTPVLHTRRTRATARRSACLGRNPGRTARVPGGISRSPACTRRPHARAGHDPARTARFRSPTERRRPFPTASQRVRSVSSRARAHRRRVPRVRTVRHDDPHAVRTITVKDRVIAVKNFATSRRSWRWRRSRFAHHAASVPPARSRVPASDPRSTRRRLH